MFSLPRSHASNRGGMFGARGGVGGASTEHALRRPHAGAETREELERLPDDVLRVIVNEARAKLRKRERLRRREEDERAAELADVAVDDSDSDGNENIKTAVPKADPVAETVLHMGDDDDDALDALGALGEKREADETQARAELARAVLAARLARRAGARRRRCLSISRDVNVGSSNSNAVAVIHPEDFERFVHRGGDAEGIDAREVARLYACCLPGRPGSRAAAADALDAHQLLRVVESGRWRRHWARYVRDARQRALEHGACAGSLAVFGATWRDPFADAASDAKVAKRVARRDDAGFPDPAFFGAFGSFRAFARYVRFCFAFVTLPLFAPLSRRRGPFQTHAEAWYVSRFALPESLRTSKTRFAVAAPLFLVAAPFWSLGVVCVFLYALRQPAFLLVDVLVPVVFAAFTTSLAAACAGAAQDFGSQDPNTRRESGKYRPSHAFPGGRAAVPDDAARVAQDDPRLVREPVTHKPPLGGSEGRGVFGRKPQPADAANETEKEKESFRPASGCGADSARTHAGFGSFGAARVAGAAADAAPDAANASNEGLSRDTDADALFDASADVRLDGEPRGKRKGRRGLAAAGRESARARARECFDRHSVSGEMVDGATTTTTMTTEKDVVDAVMRRASEETASLSARGGFLGAYLGSAPLTVRQRLAFAATATLIAAIPPAHRYAVGVDVFGGADAAFVCVDRLLPDAASALLGLATCSSLAANATSDAEMDAADYADYSPRLTSVADAVSAETSAGDAGSTTGAAIVGAAAVWTAVGAYAALTSTRWITSRAHAHYVRMRVFAAVTDPSEAAACDVPFLNLRKASLPWVRLRAHLRRARALERRWVALCVSHLTVAVVVCAFASAVAAARAHTTPRAGVGTSCLLYTTDAADDVFAG